MTETKSETCLRCFEPVADDMDWYCSEECKHKNESYSDSGGLSEDQIESLGQWG